MTDDARSWPFVRISKASRLCSRKKMSQHAGIWWRNAKGQMLNAKTTVPVLHCLELEFFVFLVRFGAIYHDLVRFGHKQAASGLTPL